MPLRVTEFATRQAASQEAAEIVAVALRDDIAATGRAVLMVSGGSTPVPMFEALSVQELSWHKVTVGLVDERWVAPEHPDSNEGLVRRHLLTRRAGAAGLVPMKTSDGDPWQAVPDRDAAYAPHCDALSMVVLGMGADGHTASWFPGDPQLASIAGAPGLNSVAGVNAPSATIPQRLTLTGSAVFKARQAILLAFGEDKHHVLQASVEADPLTYPVRYAIDGLGDRLSIYWAA
jgi:6-phosphogluconolactonase